MLKILDQELGVAANRYLQDKQTDVNGKRPYSARVERAKTLWSSKRGNNIDTIKSMLTDMCVGIRRCNYCEDSAADEIEHVKPKDLYPEVAFVWSNFLYACGPCNGPKNNKFAVFDTSGSAIEISRKRTDPVVPPLQGAEVFLNPRSENPLDFIQLDFLTFFFVPSRGLSDHDKERANYTIRILKLNERDFLVQCRKQMFQSYQDAIEAYCNRKQNDDFQGMQQKKEQLLKMNHPTVFREMQRQQQHYSDLTLLFDQAPELLEI